MLNHVRAYHFSYPQKSTFTILFADTLTTSQSARHTYPWQESNSGKTSPDMAPALVAGPSPSARVGHRQISPRGRCPFCFTAIWGGTVVDRCCGRSNRSLLASGPPAAQDPRVLLLAPWMKPQMPLCMWVILRTICRIWTDSPGITSWPALSLLLPGCPTCTFAGRLGLQPACGPVCPIPSAPHPLLCVARPECVLPL